MPHINDLINAAFERVATEFIFELPTELYCSNHKFYHSIFTNCMDSSLYFDEPNIQELYEEWRRF